MRQRDLKQRKPTLRPSMDEQSEPKRKLKVGVATEMWLELVAYSEPENDSGASSDEKNRIRSLWLRVDGVWLRHDNPKDYVEKAVLSAFGDGSGRLEVHVWYYKHYLDQVADENLLDTTDPEDAEISAYSTPIVGLVVHSRR